MVLGRQSYVLLGNYLMVPKELYEQIHRLGVGVNDLDGQQLRLAEALVKSIAAAVVVEVPKFHYRLNVSHDLDVVLGNLVYLMALLSLERHLSN